MLGAQGELAGPSKVRTAVTKVKFINREGIKIDSRIKMELTQSDMRFQSWPENVLFPMKDPCSDPR